MRWRLKRKRPQETNGAVSASDSESSQSWKRKVGSNNFEAKILGRESLEMNKVWDKKLESKKKLEAKSQNQNLQIKNFWIENFRIKKWENLDSN